MTGHVPIRYPRTMRRVFLCPPACLLFAAALLLAGCSTTPPPAPSAAARGAATTRLSPEQASDITFHALGLVGTPYRYGGNTPDSGFDCSGLIGYVYQSRAGMAPPRTVAQLGGFGQAVDAAELRTGDLVIFGRDPAWHAGIYVGDGRFVHAPNSRGRVRVERLANRYFAQRIDDARTLLTSN